MRLATALVIPLLLLGTVAASGGLPGTGGTFVSGGDLIGAVRLAAADEDAFFRRINLPPQLEEPPRTAGRPYIVTSGYWNEVVPDEDDERPAGEEALYYATGGYVRAMQGESAVWLVLDLRQRAIIDRYVRLAKDGLIGREPGILDVLSAAAKNELIGIQIDARRLSEAEASAFWAVVDDGARVSNTTASRPIGGPGGVWLIFGLLEGRSVQMLYTAAANTLVDSLGGEVYSVPDDWLLPVLGANAPSAGQPDGGSTIEQQPSSGSPLWWLVMIGGGSLSLAIALWLSRRRAGRGQVS